MDQVRDRKFRNQCAVGIAKNHLAASAVNDSRTRPMATAMPSENWVWRTIEDSETNT